MISVDILIIGAGPAGLSAALYLKRAGANFAILDKGAPGGKLLNIAEIANYPGFAPISGYDLAVSLTKPVTDLGVSIEYGDVSDVRKQGDKFIVTTDFETYECYALAIGTGLSNVPTIKGEKQFYGKGVSYCATCDGALYKNKDVVVIGHNEKALEECIYLSNIVNKVTFVIDAEQLSASETMFEAFKAKDNVEIINNAKVEEISGDALVTSVFVNGKPIPCSAVFPLSGEKSASSFLAPLGLKTKNGFIPVDSSMMSEVPGLFAIGDVVDKRLRQVVTACSDGAIASTGLTTYVRKLKR